MYDAPPPHFVYVSVHSVGFPVGKFVVLWLVGNRGVPASGTVGAGKGNADGSPFTLIGASVGRALGQGVGLPLGRGVGSIDGSGRGDSDGSDVG